MRHNEISQGHWTGDFASGLWKKDDFSEKTNGRRINRTRKGGMKNGTQKNENKRVVHGNVKLQGVSE